MVNDYFYYIEPKEYLEGQCAIFDLDGCIIVKANGDNPKYAETNRTNYTFLWGVEKIINRLMNQNIQIIIISNQSNFNVHKEFMMLDIWNFFSQKIMFLVSKIKNEWRKPSPNFLNMIKEHYRILYYCGDAIGNTNFPPFNWSTIDLDFAKNGNVAFKDPLIIFGTNFLTETPNEQVIILTGNPGSGKTTVAKRLENNGSIRYSADEHKGNLTAKKRISEITEYLKQGKQVILDATHSSNEKRQVWINLATSLNLSWKILYFCRDGRPFNELRERPVPEMAYRIYTKYFERPTENYTVMS